MERLTVPASSLGEDLRACLNDLSDRRISPLDRLPQEDPARVEPDRPPAGNPPSLVDVNRDHLGNGPFVGTRRFSERLGLGGHAV